MDKKITTSEELRDFLRAVSHESEPNLHACRWQSRDEHTVYLWYREEPYIVSGHVVSVLRKLPKPTFAQRREAFLSYPSNQILTGFLAVTFIGVTMLFILKQIFG